MIDGVRGTMNNLSFEEALLPREEYYGWDIFLYVIIAFQLILLFLLFSSTLRDVILVGVTVICAFADKAYLFGFIDGRASAAYHAEDAFLTYVIRVAMFTLPMVIVTQTKVSKAKPVAVIIAVMAFFYSFGRWYFQQRVAGERDDDLRQRSEEIRYIVMAAHFVWLWALTMPVRLKAYRRMRERTRHV